MYNSNIILFPITDLIQLSHIHMLEEALLQLHHVKICFENPLYSISLVLPPHTYPAEKYENPKSVEL